MNFYLLFIVFLYVGKCNARVVPLNFKIDKSEHVDSSMNEFDESSVDEVEILGHNLPDSGQSKDLELLNSADGNTTVSGISNGNASNLSEDLQPKAKTVDEESSLENAGSSVISNLLEEKFNLTSEVESQNNSDTSDSFETSKVNAALNNKTQGLKNETSITNNSSLDSEQQNSLDLLKIDGVTNDTLDRSETFEIISDHNETIPSFEAVNSDQNETIASFEAVNSDQNETSLVFEVANDTNSTNDFFELQPLTNDTKVEGFLSDTENITVSKTSNFTSENLELRNDSVKTAGGIFSGFEFLINSEVARNAAKAMEVFNFSDPLTDHIIEENEFHSFLPAFNAAENLDSPNETDVKTTAILTNGSEVSSEIRADFNMTGDSISVALNQTEAEEFETNSSMSSNLNEPPKEEKTKLLVSVEKFEGNVTSNKLSSSFENSEEKIQLSPTESTISKENITSSVSNSTVDVQKCPPPGWCIFWFLSQDACAANEHCLGSRICCKIGCSKTCIEIESLR